MGEAGRAKAIKINVHSYVDSSPKMSSLSGNQAAEPLILLKDRQAKQKLRKK